MNADVKPAVSPQLDIPSWVPEPIAQYARADYAEETDHAYEAFREGSHPDIAFVRKELDDRAADLLPLLCDPRMRNVWRYLSRQRVLSPGRRQARQKVAQFKLFDMTSLTSPKARRDAAMVEVFATALMCRRHDWATTVIRSQVEEERDRWLARADELDRDSATIGIERAANGDELSHNTIKGIVDKSKTTRSENAKPAKPASKPDSKPEMQSEVPTEPALQVTDGTMGNDTDPAQSAAAFAAILAAKSEPAAEHVPAERVAIAPPALSAITEKPNLLQAWDQASEEDREILCNLALDPFSRRATGTDLLNQIVNFRRKNLAEDILVSLGVHILNNGCYGLAESFLDALGVNAMLKSMSAQFKTALHARLACDPAPSTEPAAGHVQVEPAAPARPLDHTDCDGVPAFAKRAH
jgi:hypothetical protein